jgi:hypothetical protein
VPTIRASTASWTDQRLAREYRAHKAATRALIDELLQSKEQPSLAALASRETISDAADILTYIVRSGIEEQQLSFEPLKLLSARPAERLRPYLSARQFAVIPYDGDTRTAFPLEKLRTFARSRRGVIAKRARAALAFAYGEIQWSSADKAAKAGLILRLLTLQMLERR